MIDTIVTRAWCDQCNIAFGIHHLNGQLQCLLCRRIWSGPIFPIVQAHLYYCVRDDLRFGIQPGQPVRCYQCAAVVQVKSRA